MTKILRVFPRRTSYTPTDELTKIGYHFIKRKGKTIAIPNPIPLDRPTVDEVHVSCTYTWDIERAKELQQAWSQYYPVVKIGGPAFGSPCDPFIPGLYVGQGVTFTSWGCNNCCPWCLVHPREGPLREREKFYPGNILQDNNFLQCSKSHRSNVYEMLKTQKNIDMIGGLEADLLTEWDVDQLRGLRIHQLFFACDTQGGLKPLARAAQMLKGIDREDRPLKLRAYVLLAHGGQTISQAVELLEAVWRLGFMPHSQVYQPADHWINYPREWTDLNRTWSRPAAMVSLHSKALTSTV